MFSSTSLRQQKRIRRCGYQDSTVNTDSFIKTISKGSSHDSAKTENEIITTRYEFWIISAFDLVLRKTRHNEICVLYIYTLFNVAGSCICLLFHDMSLRNFCYHLADSVLFCLHNIWVTRYCSLVQWFDSHEWESHIELTRVHLRILQVILVGVY